MSVEAGNYVLLRAAYTGFPDDFSWRISYKKDVDGFLLEDLFSGKNAVVEDANIVMEIFINNANKDIYGAAIDFYGRTARLQLWLCNKLYSESICSESKAIPEDVASQYVSSLKEID